ncbi:MAG: hypothetical protein HY556_03115 [Euryarchaeota archaeon]|nr:hypothetical protein [Euryarchaeota archaeon]
MSRLEAAVRSIMEDPEKRGKAFKLAWVLSLIFLAFGYFVIFYLLTTGRG